ncbi:MAG: xanthine dehydrogenase accessory protein XdhC [Alphaproteobacteria bacterium]|nr:xanthine dehydrogenase accessory protein XdhC [Alphaproteobacteria bacterium]
MSGGTNHDWLPVLTGLTEKGTPCVLITVMEAKGSTPREAGVKMIATAGEQFGTIGGGNLEFQAVEAARALLQSATGPQVKDYPLGPKLAQCCGGAVTVFLEPFVANDKTLYLFGAGHVGREVVKVLDGLPVKVKWIDARADEFPGEAPKNCEKILTNAPAAELRDIDENSFIVIMTHSHDLDYELVRGASKNGKFAYLGLIGSATKRAKFEKRLKAEGVSPEDLLRLVCPIGVGGVTGKHPREIAIAVAAQLLGLGLARAVKQQEENPKERDIA